MLKIFIIFQSIIGFFSQIDDKNKVSVAQEEQILTENLVIPREEEEEERDKIEISSEEEEAEIEP